MSIMSITGLVVLIADFAIGFSLLKKLYHSTNNKIIRALALLGGASLIPSILIGGQLIGINMGVFVY